MREALRIERLRRAWSCDRVAAELCRVAHGQGLPTPGVNGHMVNRWERGVRRPSLFYIEVLAALYGRAPEELGLVASPLLRLRDGPIAICGHCGTVLVREVVAG